MLVMIVVFVVMETGDKVANISVQGGSIFVDGWGTSHLRCNIDV